MAIAPFSAAVLEKRLAVSLDPALSSRRTAAEPARALARFSRRQQNLVLRWVNVIARTNAELAYAFAANAPQVLRSLEEQAVEAWGVSALDVYDREGLYPASHVLTDPAAFIRDYEAARAGVAFDDVRGVLEYFVRGLSGRALKLAAANECYTDTETLRLPRYLSVFRAHDDNYRLYKAMASHQWAQTWYGTFRGDPAQVLRGLPEPESALRLFHLLETVRLDACLERDLPGLRREMSALAEAQADPPQFPPSWREHLTLLRRRGARVDDTLAAVRALYDPSEPLPAPYCYQGTLRAEAAHAVLTARVRRVHAALGRSLQRLRADLHRERGGEERLLRENRFELRRVPDAARPDGFRAELAIDGAPVPLPQDLRGLLDSVVQDLGDVPDAFLVPADGAVDRAGDIGNDAHEPDEGWLYDEWDHYRRHYRKDWCVLVEHDVQPQDEPFVRQTLEKYAGLASRLRRSFEALRGDDRLLKRLSNGDHVDLDALVEAVADAHSGRELTDRLFVKRRRVERDIAVMFMVDMSGSTKGWINDAERESLVLLCEALQVLGDRYAIYGFSGNTRKRCELYRVKRLDEPYGEAVRARIAGIRAQDYTRMGVIIRHLTQLLDQVAARTKLLITLSDGKPDDYDGYGGQYGIEDTRQALVEAKRRGIHPFCITIDKEARDYLPHMYGPVNYTLVDDVWKLPARVSEIYRKLTT